MAGGGATAEHSDPSTGGDPSRSGRKLSNGKYDVSDLMKKSNTLSNPNNKKTKIEL